MVARASRPRRRRCGWCRGGRGPPPARPGRPRHRRCLRGRGDGNDPEDTTFGV